MKTIRPLLVTAVLSLSLLTLPGQAQEWKSLLRMADWGGEVLDAPEGYRILSAPSPDAPVVETVAGPTEVAMVRYLEIGEARYYLTEDQSNLVWDGGTPQWISIPGTERASFIRETIPAQLIKRETRDFFKTGPQTAEVYEETVSLAAVTEWGPGYRRAELDFRLPVKVREVRRNPDDSWEATFTVFPAFDSNVSRLPGKRPENWGEPYEVLMTRPREREVRLRGPQDGERFASLLLPETVWAAEISEGRIQGLRVGYHDLQPPLEVSRLSAPEFVSGREMAFRFSVSRLLADPLVFTVKPDRVTGVDGTYYQGIALLGGAEDRSRRGGGGEISAQSLEYDALAGSHGASRHALARRPWRGGDAGVGEPRTRPFV